MPADFSGSSRNISLSGSFLNAQCEGADGQFHDSSLNLNDIIGNNNGQFIYPGSGWFDSAESASLDGGRILQASLRNASGSSSFAEINLDG